MNSNAETPLHALDEFSKNTIYFSNFLIISVNYAKPREQIFTKLILNIKPSLYAVNGSCFCHD